MIALSIKTTKIMKFDFVKILHILTLILTMKYCNSQNTFSEGQLTSWADRYERCVQNSLPLIVRFRSRGKNSVQINSDICFINFACKSKWPNGDDTNCEDNFDIGLKYNNLLVRFQNYDNWVIRIDDDVVVNIRRIKQVINRLNEEIRVRNCACTGAGSSKNLFFSGAMVFHKNAPPDNRISVLSNGEDMMYWMDSECCLFDLSEYYVGQDFNKVNANWLMIHDYVPSDD